MSDVREKYVSNSTGNPFLILDCTNSFPPSLHILKVGRYTLGAIIIITAKKMALKVWCHWLGLSLLCFFILYFYFFISFSIHFYILFLFLEFEGLVWLMHSWGAVSLSLPIELFRATPPSSWVHQHHSASLCTTLHQYKMCTAHPSFVHPRIVKLCIDAKMFAHCAFQLQGTLCTDDINLQCAELIVPVFWFHILRFTWTVYSTSYAKSSY